ncbi:MAG: hypothetical protein ABIN58_03235 [candidate division WOR-3 bacterium]
MIWFVLLLLSQSSGDTLRWYDTTAIGYYHIGLVSGGYFHWAIILPIDSEYDGRTVHSGRVHIWEAMDSSGVMRLCEGDLYHPFFLLGSGTFHSTGYGFYEVLFGDSLVLHTGDTVWLWCTQWHAPGHYPATTDAGPCYPYYASLASVDGVNWGPICTYYFDYRWVMELILTPLDVEEGPAKPEEKMRFLPAPGGFYITGYEGPAQIYDPAGRLILSKEVKGKTLIGPLRPGVYFVVAGRQRARVAVQ